MTFTGVSYFAGSSALTGNAACGQVPILHVNCKCHSGSKPCQLLWQQLSKQLFWGAHKPLQCKYCAKRKW